MVFNAFTDPVLLSTAAGGLAFMNIQSETRWQRRKFSNGFVKTWCSSPCGWTNCSGFLGPWVLEGMKGCCFLTAFKLRKGGVFDLLALPEPHPEHQLAFLVRVRRFFYHLEMAGSLTWVSLYDTVLCSRDVFILCVSTKVYVWNVWIMKVHLKDQKFITCLLQKRALWRAYELWPSSLLPGFRWGYTEGCGMIQKWAVFIWFFICLVPSEMFVWKYLR